MIETAILCAALAGTGDVWFTPRPNGDQWWCQGAHTSIACCYQFTLPPEQAEHVESFINCGLFAWWNGEGLSWKVIPDGHPSECDGWGFATGSYPLGEMEETYDGPMGLLTFDEPTALEPAHAPCQQPWVPPAFWFDGEIPATPMVGSWHLTCAGDYDGNCTVNVGDWLYVLAFWGCEDFPNGYTVLDSMAVLANWGLSCE